MAPSKQIVLIALIAQILLIRPSQSCGGRQLMGTGVSEREKQIIVSQHNSMRQSVALGQISGQPSSSNMQEMKWDEGLARRAQEWAQSCFSEQHDQSRHEARFSVGQNIATTWTTKQPDYDYETAADWPDAISKWFTEYRNYRYGKLFHVDNSFGHYTQMMWADTNLVGCGYAFYYDSRKGYTKNYICNYGPSGNVINQRPYVAGPPSCQSSGMAPSSTYQGLCAAGYQGGYQSYFEQRPAYHEKEDGYYNYYHKNYNTYRYYQQNYYK